MNNPKIIATLFVIIFLCNFAYPDTGYLENEWNEKIHPVITYHADLDASFLSRWWDINYPILYTPGATTGPWGGRGGEVTVDNRDIALRSLVQEFISLLDFDYAKHGSNSIFISQKDIVDGPLVITEPGVYHLRESITAARGMAALIVTVDHVIINLNGFTIHGRGVGADAIVVESRVKGVTICNGKIRDAAADGIHVYQQTHEINLINLDIKGCLNNGCFVGSTHLVILDCEATYNKNAAFRFNSDIPDYHLINILAAHTGGCDYPEENA